MTSPTILSQPVGHPTAWTATDIGSKDDFAVKLTERHIAAFEASVAGLRERGRTAFKTIVG